MSRISQAVKSSAEHTADLFRLQEDLTKLIEEWKKRTFAWGNDLGKIKTEAYRECANELRSVLEPRKVLQR